MIAARGHGGDHDDEGKKDDTDAGPSKRQRVTMPWRLVISHGGRFISPGKINVLRLPYYGDAIHVLEIEGDTVLQRLTELMPLMLQVPVTDLPGNIPEWEADFRKYKGYDC